MNPEQPTTHRDDLDDTEGHLHRSRMADAERDEADDTDDTEGHRRHFFRADAERDEADDADADGRRYADAEGDEADDTGGHALGPTAREPVRGAAQGLQPTHPKVSDDADDVAGHLSGALGSKKKTEHER